MDPRAPRRGRSICRTLEAWIIAGMARSTTRRRDNLNQSLATSQSSSAWSGCTGFEDVDAGRVDGSPHRHTLDQPEGCNIGDQGDRRCSGRSPEPDPGEVPPRGRCRRPSLATTRWQCFRPQFICSDRQEIQHVLGQATNSPSRMTRWPSRASTSPVSSGRESPTWRPVRVRTRRLSSTYTRARQPSHLASAHQNGWSPLGSPVIASMGCRTGSGTGPSLEHRGRLGKWTWPYRRWEHLSAPSGCKSGHARHAGRPGRRRARGRRG